MSKLRRMQFEDIESVRQIHQKFYKEEFHFPDFSRRFINPFIVEDSKGIVSAGGFMPQLEAVIITNKDASVSERFEAFYEVLCYGTYTVGQQQITQLHTFVQDENWERTLKKAGFTEARGKMLVLELNHG